ncbi:MAG: hypothetical protein N4A63_03810 [Vallitalea sp.]|jgi:hypothetical protein|nr:hypothetical protein [Vallitalea sp.]
MLNNEELEYKELIKSIEELEVRIPNDLHEKVEESIQSLNHTKNKFMYTIGKVVAVFVISFLCILTLIYNNENFATFASSIPGLNIITEWIYQDKGLKNAHDNNYPYIEDLVYEKDGYKLILSNIMIDEERISFNALINGECFNKSDILETKTKETDYVEKNKFEFSFRLVEGQFLSSESLGLRGNNEASNVIIDFCEDNYIYNLIKNKKNLQLECYILNDKRKKILVMDDIKIPVNKDNVLFTKKYFMNETLDYNKGKIDINEFVISPTKMKLITSSIPKQGIDAIELHNYYLKDNRGNIYNGEGVIDINGYKSYSFIPSSYFNKNINKLYLYYNSYSYRYNEKYTLSFTDTFPKTINYHGYEIRITEMSYKYNNLSISMEYDNTDSFIVQGINVLGDLKHGIRSISFTPNNDNPIIKLIITYQDIEYRDIYDIELFSPSIIVKEKGKIRIK